MIKGLIATLMISMGVATSATPSFNNNESKPPLLLNNTNSGTTTTDFELALSYVTYTTGSTSDPETDGYTINTYKYEYSGYNNALSVLCHTYTQTDYTTDTTTSTNYIFIPGLSVENKYTNMLVSWQITPYKYLVDSTTTLYVYIRVKPTYSDYTLRLNYDLISSTNQDWASYIDMSNYATAYNNYTTFNYLKNAENGYTYNEKEKYEDLDIRTTTTNQIQVEYEEEIEIVYDETNYIFLLITPQWQVNTPRITTQEVTNGNRWAATYTESHPLISGTMIIPPTSSEVVDIPGLMFEVLTMPFAFISQAFNLTLFPGTPYQLNLSNLFLSIIGVLVFIFIIKLLVKSKFGG